MRDPRMVAVVFESMVRCIGAGLMLRRMLWPVAALLIVSVLAAHDGPAVKQIREAVIASAEDVGHAVGLDEWFGREHLRSAAQTSVDPDIAIDFGPAPKLSTEQANLARFIAQTYRIAEQRTAHYVDFVYKIAREKQIDPMLILGLIAVESSFNAKAESHKGAQGLMQVLTRVHTEKFAPYGGSENAFEPFVNIRVGVRILQEYIQREGNVSGGLKSYVGAALMTEDGGYGSKVLFEKERFAAVAAGKTPPAYPSAGTKAGAGPTPTNPTGTEALVIEPLPTPEPKLMEGRDSALLQPL
jgi:Transglycosylase SLT domain